MNARTFQSYILLKRPQASYLNMPMDVPTVTARNVALETAAATGVKALLFIDSDMEFAPDAYEKLNLIKADIVCGLFYTRSTPSCPTVMVRSEESEGRFSLRSIVPDKKIQDIHACGMAFTILRKPVIDWALREAAEKGLPAFRHVNMSEDLDFVNRATQAGFKAKCDTSVVIGHRGEIGFAGQPELCMPTSGHLTNPYGTVRS